MDIVVAFLAPAVVGVVVGILSGLLGIGGGTILVPAFRLAFGMSPQTATATSLFTIVPTSVSGVVSHVRNKTCVVWLGVACGVGGALTSPCGVWLACVSPGWLIMLTAALIIGYSAVNMLRKALRTKKEDGEPKSSDVRAAAGAPALKATPARCAKGISIGLFAGLASGYVGVGGGFIMVPLMLSLLSVDMKRASGTSLIAVSILAIPGVVTQALLGNIHYLSGIAIAVGSIPGAVLGARLVRVVPERRLRFLFGGFLVVAAIVLALNEFGVLG